MYDENSDYCYGRVYDQYLEYTDEMCFNIAHPLYGYNYTCTDESFLINLSDYLNLTNDTAFNYYFMKHNNETNSTPYLDSWLDLIGVTADGLGDYHPRTITRFDGMTSSTKEYNISGGKLINLTLWNATNLDMATMSLIVKSSGTTAIENFTIDMGNDGVIDTNLTSINTWTTIEFDVDLFNELDEITDVTTQLVTIPFNFSSDAGDNITIRSIEFKRESVYYPEDLYMDIGNSSYDDIYLPGELSATGITSGLSNSSSDFEVIDKYSWTSSFGAVYEIYFNTSHMANTSVTESYLMYFQVPSFVRVYSTEWNQVWDFDHYYEYFYDLSNINQTSSTATLFDDIGYVRSSGENSKVESNILPQAVNLTNMYLAAGYTNFSGIDTSFYVSNDGKATWEEVTLSNSGVTELTEHTFSSSGSDFAWKVEFNGTTYVAGDYGYLWRFNIIPNPSTGFEFDSSKTPPYKSDTMYNSTVDIGNNGIDIRWANQSDYGKSLTNAINRYTLANCTDEITCTIPVNFSLQGPGAYAIQVWTINYNLSEMGFPEQPFNYYLKDKAVALANRTVFNDSSSTKQINTSTTGYISIPREVLAHDFNLTITGDYQ